MNRREAIKTGLVMAAAAAIPATVQPAKALVLWPSDLCYGSIDNQIRIVFTSWRKVKDGWDFRATLEGGGVFQMTLDDRTGSQLIEHIKKNHA
jgi:hypothetical protein